MNKKGSKECNEPLFFFFFTASSEKTSVFSLSLSLSA